MYDKLSALSSIQADWNQNDSQAVDYVKNRTHWAEHDVLTEILPATTFKATVEDGDSYWWFDDLVFSALWSAGDRVVVTCNGVEYNLIVYDREGEWLALGNAHIFDESSEDTGEPFYIDIFDWDTDEGWQIGGICVAESGTYTFSIKAYQTIYHTLDPKYIKDMYWSEQVENRYFDPRGLNKSLYPGTRTISRIVIDGVLYTDITGTSISQGGCRFEIGESSVERSEHRYTAIAYRDSTGFFNSLYIYDNEVDRECTTFYFPVIETVYHTIDENYIPETIARSSTVAQADWSEDDTRNPAYIRNKPTLECDLITGISSTSDDEPTAKLPNEFEIPANAKEVVILIKNLKIVGYNADATAYIPYISEYTRVKESALNGKTILIRINIGTWYFASVFISDYSGNEITPVSVWHHSFGSKPTFCISAYGKTILCGSYSIMSL